MSIIRRFMSMFSNQTATNTGAPTHTSHRSTSGGGIGSIVRRFLGR